MHWFDVIAIVIIILGGVRGLQRGGISELFGTAALVGGAMATLLWGTRVAAFISVRSDIRFVGVVGFLLVFVAAYLVIVGIGGILQGIIERADMHNLNRALGMFAGLVKGLLIVFLLLAFLTWQSVIELEADLSQSITYTSLSWLLKPVMEFLLTRAG